MISFIPTLSFFLPFLYFVSCAHQIYMEMGEGKRGDEAAIEYQNLISLPHQYKCLPDTLDQE